MKHLIAAMAFAGAVLMAQGAPAQVVPSCTGLACPGSNTIVNPPVVPTPTLTLPAAPTSCGSEICPGSAPAPTSCGSEICPGTAPAPTPCGSEICPGSATAPTPCGSEICPEGDGARGYSTGKLLPSRPTRVRILATSTTGTGMEFELDGRELADMERMSGLQQSQLLAKSIARRLTKGQGVMAMDRMYQALLAEMGNRWCGPCRVEDGAIRSETRANDGTVANITAWF